MTDNPPKENEPESYKGPVLILLLFISVFGSILAFIILRIAGIV